MKEKLMELDTFSFSQVPYRAGSGHLLGHIKTPKNSLKTYLNNDWALRAHKKGILYI